jgi:voltage-gated potassium channel
MSMFHRVPILWCQGNLMAAKKFRKHIVILRQLFRSFAGVRLVLIFAAVMLLSSLVVFFVEHTRNEGFVTFFDSLWWTIVTVSTVGYGDRYPVSVSGRVIAILIMFLGVGVMGTVTGRIASFLLERRMKAEKGLLSYEKLKGHFIICGWKREMDIFLRVILSNNQELDSEQMVLINRASSEEINNLRSDELLKNVRFVFGDYIEERDLLRAGIKDAGRVLVVADHFAQGNLQQIDSKTVMAVMTIKNLNKKAYVCAELLDTKFEKYLKLSHCDEILLSREFSRSMLASAAQGVGTSHVVSALLAHEGGAQMTTIDLPDSFVGATYEEVRHYCNKDNRMLLIGLLENTGNLLARKSEALRETQKNPDIHKIITDLRTIKELTANVPVINPPPDYSIKKYSRGIVINGSTTGEVVAT